LLACVRGLLREDVPVAQHLLGLPTRFWEPAGQLAAVASLAADALTLDTSPRPERAFALWCATVIARVAGRTDDAAAYARDALVLCDQFGLDALRPQAMGELARQHIEAGQQPEPALAQAIARGQCADGMPPIAVTPS
jgi:hypothetical protein